MKRIRKLLAVVITLTVILGMFAFMTGCGDNGGSSASSSGVNDGDTSSDTVFVSEFTPIVGDEFSNGISSAIYYEKEGRFLISTYGVIADNTPEGVIPEYEGEYWEWGQIFYWLDLDGNSEKLENYTLLPVPEIEGQDEVNGSSYTQSICLTSDGTIVTLDDLWLSYYDGPEELTYEDDGYWNYYISEEHYYIRTFSADGTELSCNLLDGVNESDYFYPYGMAVDDDDNVYIVYDSGLLVMDLQGTLLYKIVADTYFENVIKLSDGRIALLSWGDGYELYFIDTEAKALGESISLPGNVYTISPGAGEYDFYYTNGSNFFGYDIETGENAKLFNWINCDVNNFSANNSVTVLPDGKYLFIISEWDSDYSELTNELVTIVEKPASSVPQKTVLTFATMYLDYDVRSQIIKFNRNNSEYRIEVRDYSEYNTEDDYSAGQTKLTAELLAGNAPDIIDLNGMPMERLVAAGQLEDLYTYLDSDSELSRDDFFPNILKALELNGGLYRTVSNFTISTVIGATSIVGDKPGWTIDEFKDAYAKMPEGCTVFYEYSTRDDMLYTMLTFEMDDLVDWTTGECSFDSDTFKDILAFVDSFPSEFDWENYDYSWSTSEKLQSGQQMLMQTTIYDFEYPRLYEALFGTDITFIGFPTKNGVGNSLNFNGTELAISSKSENKEAAWEFVRQYFTTGYLDEYSWGFPINKQAFDELLEKAMTPEYATDANGNYVLDENGNKIEISQGAWGYDDITVEMYALTQEQADQILELIETTTRVVNYDNAEIINIVQQEAAAYFEGQKTADEVAKLVQSKVYLYVNEMR